jgi:hypothetical protein
MVPPDLWLEVLSWVKTLFELTKSTVDLVDLERTHQKYRHDPETIQEARRVSAQFQTFSEPEVKSLLDRIQGCRDRFISQGGGTDRARCICSVLNEARAGNGGNLPLIDDWRKIYDQLACANHA